MATEAEAAVRGRVRTSETPLEGDTSVAVAVAESLADALAAAEVLRGAGVPRAGVTAAARCVERVRGG